MKKEILNTSILIFGFFIAVLFQGCATSGSVADSNHIYSKPFNKMANIVEYAVESSNLIIYRFFKSEDGTKITFIVGSNVLLGGRSVQEEQGKVTVTKLETRRIQVEVENPEYHYTVPHYQRKKYRRIIFNRIDSILNKEKA